MNVPIGALDRGRDAAQAAASTRTRDAARGSTGPAWSPSAAALFCLVFALIRGNAEGWGSTTIVGLLVASAALLIAFVVAERTGREPDARPRARSASRAFTGAQIAAFSISASMFSMFLYLTLYMQNVLEVLAAPGGPALPAGVGPVVLRRAAGRPAHQPRAGSRAHLRRARGRRHRPAADGRRVALLGVDDAAGRVPHRRHRRGLRERAAQLRRGERRASSVSAARPRGSTTPSAR